jgi:chloramphenicol 3-O phosphotransferase
VRCPLEELNRREKERGDRMVGAAAMQFELVHQHGDYDLECDSGSASPRECAEQIKEFLPRQPARNAFTRLRERYLAV